MVKNLEYSAVWRTESISALAGGKLSQMIGGTSSGHYGSLPSGAASIYLNYKRVREFESWK